ncbi:AraC family transcriptional regulator [Kiloniella antarctica]|uniref:AraC family transcriptional regulator N-terminal domain-containing protein n=1 Tax=Kiloniella antarctica TaxID=1550907 RepID=A0ABW5BLS8_9PROT
MDDADALIAIVGRLAPDEGENLTAIPDIKLYRHEESFCRRPYMYGPCICVVVQGRKRMYYGGAGNQDKYNDYNPRNYLINSVSLPIESDAYDLSPEQPFLAIQLDIDQALASRLIAEIGPARGPKAKRARTADIEAGEIIGAPRGDNLSEICEDVGGNPVLSGRADSLDISLSSPLTDNLQRIVLRLIKTLDDPVDARVLAPAITHELYYEVLCGPRGVLLRNCVANDTYANKIAPIVHYIERHFDRPIEIDTLVAVAGMSASSLHSKFKQATTMTPIQFIKNFRLHKARRLILSGTSAGDASFAVGYNSPSQFSREYKRLFNQSPKETSSQIRMI